MEDIDSRLYAIPTKCDRERNSWLPLPIHLKDTSNILEWLYREWLPRSERLAMLPDFDHATERAVLNCLGMLHDLGKATPSFVAHIANSGGMPELLERLEKSGYPTFWPSVYAVTHAAAGEALLLSAGAPVGIASIIGAHHGKPQDAEKLRFIWNNYEHLIRGRSEDGNTWTQAQEEIIHWAVSQGGIPLDKLPTLSDASQMLLCGLLIMADWISSNTYYFPMIPIEDDGRDADSEHRFQDALERLKLPACWQTEAEAFWADRIYDLRFGRGETPFIPRPMQIEAAQTASQMLVPGLIILEAPMGSGKTEAALAVTELIAFQTGAGGIFFGLPTQATANALFGRLKDWAERQSEDAVNTIMLSHRMAMMNPLYQDLLKGTPEDVTVGEESGLEVHSFFQGKKTALLSSFVVGTIDQLLMAALRRKHVMLRQLGLAGKVVIVDEVHAYDAYMSRYLQRVLQWLGAWGTPVVLLSATLPAAARSQLMDAYLGIKPRKKDTSEWRTSIEYPLLTWSDGGQVRQRTLTGDGRRIKVRTEIIPDEARIDILKDKLSNGGCAGVVCNTVARAQSFAMAVSKAMPELRVILCHAQFVMPERARIEEELLQKLGRDGKRPIKLVLVGTQVIEQSLDIDLDVLITDLCPMDLLLQRIGRLHRHERSRPARMVNAECYIAAATDDALKDHPIYEEYLLRRTRDKLRQQLVIPDDIAGLVQQTYSAPEGTENNAEKLQEMWERMTRNIKTQEEKADAYRLRPPMRRAGMIPATLNGILEADEKTDDVQAEASVRGGGSSVEVLLLRRTGEGKACTITGEVDEGIASDNMSFSLNHMPSTQEAMIIAQQRLKLPWSLCAPWRIDQTIALLERQTSTLVPEWEQSHWLKGELILLLNEDGKTVLNGFQLSYDKQYGMICERYEEVSGDESVL